MKYYVSDVNACLEIAFDIKKVLFQLIGVLVAGAGLLLLTWLGSSAGNPVIIAAVEALGILFFIAIVALAAGGISFMAYKELTTGEKISVNGALTFAKNNISSLVVSPLLLVVCAAALFAVEYAVFMLGRVPAGQILVAILSAPVLLLNAFVVLFVILGIFIVFAVVASENTGTIETFKKTLFIIKKAYLQILMGIALTLLIGILVLSGLFFALAAGIFIALSIFGSASGLFMELASVEVPSLSSSMQAAWLIFIGFAVLIFSILGSYKLVYLKIAAVSIYLKVKEDLK